jgi:hypothetical protein
MKMDKRGSILVLSVARPAAGNDVPRLIRELRALDGVARVEPMSTPPRLLRVEHDRSVIAVRALLARARRAWRIVRVVRAVDGHRKVVRFRSRPLRATIDRIVLVLASAALAAVVWLFIGSSASCAIPAPASMLAGIAPGAGQAPRLMSALCPHVDA